MIIDKKTGDIELLNKIKPQKLKAAFLTETWDLNDIIDTKKTVEITIKLKDKLKNNNKTNSKTNGKTGGKVDNVTLYYY